MMHMNDLTETMISREDKFKGRIVGVHVDQVRLPNGNTAPREVVDHGGGVSVLMIVVITGGACVACGGIGFAVWFFLFRRKNG